jgi:tRNA A37 threonylcarbamoyladenosine dehydratase
VYDTGNKHDISHADICQTISSRVEGSKMRLKLRKAFTEKPITLDVVFTTSNN